MSLKLEGAAGTISVRAFLSAVDNAVRVLADLDAGISKIPRGSLEWVVADLFTGSLGVEVESHSRIEDLNAGPEVAEAFVSGLEQIEQVGTTPAFLTETGMANAQRLVKLIGKGGTSGLVVTNLGQQHSVTVTARASANVDMLVQTRHRSIGSIEGRLNTISLQRGARFIVYRSRTNKAVTCRFSPESTLLEQAKQALGKRVNVQGVVHSNAKGEPLRIDAENLRIFRAEDELPTSAEIAGSIPDLTGTMSTREFLQVVRGG